MARAAPTFEEVATEFIAEHIKGLTNRKVKMQWTNSMVAHVYPHLGSLPVDKVDTPHVLQTLRPIWTEKQETARRLRQRIGKILDWAKAQGYRTGDDPVTVIANANIMPAQNKAVKHHAALAHEDVPQFLARLRSSTAEISTRLAFEFLILTACRVQEVVKGRWEEVNWEECIWTVPGPRMKVKTQPHVVLLSDRAVEILKAAKALGSEYMFPSPMSKRKPVSTGTFDAYIDRVSMTGQVTAHGFRSSFRRWAGTETSFDREAIEISLAHTIGKKVELAYWRNDPMIKKRRGLMQAWADYIGGGTVNADNVLPFKEKVYG